MAEAAVTAGCGRYFRWMERVVEGMGSGLGCVDRDADRLDSES